MKMRERVCIEDLCKRIYAGGDVPKDRFSEVKTEEFTVPIYANAEKDEGLYGYTDEAKEYEPSITVAARGTIGYTAIRKTPFLPVVRLITVVPKLEMVDLRYMYYALKSCKPKSSGTSIPQLTVPDIKKYSFEMPLKDEQILIVSILDSVQNIIDKRKKEILELDNLIKSRFVEMFGTPNGNEKGFPMLTVHDVIEFTGGSQPDKKYFEYEQTTDNIRLIQIRDYKTDNYITYIPKSMAKRFCEADDIMIGRYGPPIFQILKGIEGSYNVALMKATPKMGNKEFIRYFLKQDCLFNYLDGLSQRTAGQSGIEMPALKAYPFPYPPIELQEEFEQFVQKVTKLKFFTTMQIKILHKGVNRFGN